jgi:hypothetical protein
MAEPILFPTASARSVSEVCLHLITSGFVSTLVSGLNCGNDW